MVANTVEYAFPKYNYSYDTNIHGGKVLERSLSEIRANIAPLRFGIAAKAIINELQITKGERVLELGSGLGLLGKAIKERVDSQLNYFGTDIIFDSVDQSNQKGISSIQANVISLPFANNTFDAIVTTDVLEHVPQAEESVKEIRRVLKPGGKAFVVIADPSEGRFDYVDDHIDRSKTGSDISYWEKMFKEQGMEVIDDKSNKYRRKDWRKMFNLPFLVKLKDKAGFACAFNPINRPGTYIIRKP